MKYQGPSLRAAAPLLQAEHIPRPQLSPFFLQSPFSLHLSGGVGRALFDCQCWIRGIERGWQRAGGTCFGFVALLKWPLWYGSQQRHFAACRGVLTLRFEAHEVSGAIPAGSRAAPAGGTYPPDLSSVRFLRVRPSSILQMEWGGLFFSPHQVPCLFHRLDGLRARLQNVTEGGGISV